MNGPIALLHVVGSEKVGHTSQSMEETVFETEDWCGSNDCCFREDTADDFLASSLDKDLLASETPWRPGIHAFVRKNSDEEFLLAL